MSINPGGPATITGIQFQMLGSLLELSNLTEVTTELSPDKAEIRSALVVLEPAAGGDAVVGTRVLQYKTRSGEATWSFREIVQDVLPDLYKAVETGIPKKYEFMAEGRRGRWLEVETWLAELRGKKPPETGSQAVGTLSETRTLTFSGSLAGEGTTSEMSERALFLAVAAIIRNKTPKLTESEEETYLKLWHLLTSFECRWGQKANEYRDKLRRRLRPLLANQEDVDATLSVLLQDIQQSASAGNAPIDAKAFFEKHGLNVVAFERWLPLVAKGRECLKAAFLTLGYHSDADVRGSGLTMDEQTWWASDRKFAILNGPSGQGKTWRLAAIASLLSDDVIVAVIRARGNAVFDKEEIERLISQDLRGQGAILTLQDMARRVKQETPLRANNWLCVFVDNVWDIAEVNGLWDVLAGIDGVRTVLSATPEVANAFVDRQTDQALLPVSDFSDDELCAYVANGSAERFYEIDASVRETIRRPLLASLYREVAGGTWKPENEYSLYHEFFERRLVRPLGRDVPTLLTRLNAAALSVWSGGQYPFDIGRLEALGFTDEHIRKAVSIGWFVRDDRYAYRVWHDRLLEWQIGEELARQLEAGTVTATSVAQRWLDDLRTSKPTGEPLRGFWAMDLIWQLAKRGPPVSDVLDSILKAAEGDYLLERALYEELLPTIGVAIAPAIARRMRETMSPASQTLRRQIAKVLARFDDLATEQAMVGHLSSSNWELRSAALKYFRQHPCSSVITPLWARYSLVVSDSTQGYRIREDREIENTWERMDVYDALEQCAPLDPGWIERRIEEADPANERVSALAAFLRNLPDGRARWKRLRGTLEEKLQGGQEIQRAQAAFDFVDSSEIAWLRQNISRPESGLSWACMQALIRIDIDTALDALDDYPAIELYMTRNTILASLLADKPGETVERLTELMRDRPDQLWDYAQAFVDEPNAFSEAAVELLLDDLTDRLESGTPESLYRSFQALEGITAPNLLKCLTSRSGTALDDRFATMLVERAPIPTFWQNALLETSVGVLSKIGGPGLTRVVNHWLETDDSSAIRDALELAYICPDGETKLHLRRLAIEPFEDDRRFWQRGEAGKELGLVGEWHSVVESFVRWHKETNRDLVNARLGLGPLPADDVEPALAALRLNDRDPGAIMALGFGQLQEYVDKFAGLLAGEAEENDLTNACFWSLLMMPTLSDEASNVVAAKVQGSADWVPIQVLIKDGSELSIESLLSTLEAEYQAEITLPMRMDRVHTLTAIAKSGLKNEATHSRTLALCLARINGAEDVSKDLYALDLLRRVGMSAHVRPEYAEILREPKASKYYREVAFKRDGSLRYVGDKLGAIRGLSMTSPNDAYAAALLALRNPDALDREFMPEELIELDRQRAIDVLFEYLAEERTEVLRTSVARSLASTLSVDSLVEQLSASEIARRRSATFVAGFADYEENLVSRLRQMLRDTDTKVYEASIKALRKIAATKVAAELVRAWSAEQDIERKWLYLRAAMESGDPGDALQELPVWAKPLIKDAPYLVYDLVTDRFKKRQEDYKKKLESDDFRSRV